MKKLLVFILTMVIGVSAYSQDVVKKKLEFDKNKTSFEVEATCGNCMYKMKGDGCHLAIKLNGKNYFVDGTEIDDHGDAHDAEGFCNAIKKAKVQGSIVGDRFLVTYFELVKNK
jgi:hypothetical protein